MSEQEWRPIETCPVRAPVWVVVNGVVSAEFVHMCADGTWIDKWFDKFLNIKPSHWYPMNIKRMRPPPPFNG